MSIQQLINTLTENAFESKKCFHGDKKTACSLVNALHIAMSLNPKEIIFLGVDLYDSKYFWMKENKTRHTVRNKGQTFKSRHATHNRAIHLVRCMKKTKYTFISGVKKSLLNSIIDYKNIKELV